MTETRLRMTTGLLCIAAIIVLSISEIVSAHARNGSVDHACMLPPPAGLALPPRGMHPPLFDGGLTMRPWALPDTDADRRDADLSEAQQEQIFALVHAQQPAIREALKTASKALRALHQLAQTEPFDKARAQQLADAQAGALSKVALLNTELEAAFQALLTDEQRKQMTHQSDCAPQP